MSTPRKPPVPIYLKKNIKDLKDSCHLKLKGKPAERILKSAKKLYLEAYSTYLERDEEKSFELYMKFLEALVYIKETKEYKQNKKNLANLIPPNKWAEEAMVKADELQDSLTKRYKELEKQELEKKRSSTVNDFQVPPAKPSHQQNGYEGVNGSIKSSKLRQIMMEVPKKSILILDTRSREKFIESHIKHDSCVNVPENTLQDGKTANILETSLPATTRRMWADRGNVDFLVILDSNSTVKTLEENCPLAILQKIISEWDPSIKYKSSPVILEGGYEDWLHTYPTYTTNARPKTSESESDNDDSLKRVNYPSLEEPKAPEVLSTNRRNEIISDLKPEIDRNLKPDIDRSSKPDAGRYVKPEIDRSSKATALKIYECKGKDSLPTSDDQPNSKVSAENGYISQEGRDKQSGLKKAYSSSNSFLEDKEQFEEEFADKFTKSMKIQNVVNRKEKLSNNTEDLINSNRNNPDCVKINQVDCDLNCVPSKDNSPGSAMKKSFSSPNISEMENNVHNTHKSPQVDRTIKPANKVTVNTTIPSKSRDFEPVFGNKGKGLTGLKNLGNTCYMNSILQCLSNTPCLTKYFVDWSYVKDINKETETRGEVAVEVAHVVRALWQGNARCISCKDLRAVVGYYREQFQSSQQQDSNEFLTILMDWLHEDLKIKRKINPQKMENENSPHDKYWNLFYNNNSSIIVDLFYGQQKSTVTCTHCNKESVTYETFSNLTLPLPSSNSCTLDDCIKLYLQKEQISGWMCPKCKEQRNACKKFDIIRLPRVLIIHLKRFYIDGWCRKRQTFVDFPVNNLSLKVPHRGQENFNLYAVSNHYGSMEGGHYTAFCKNSEYNKWYKFDDHDVSDISPGDVKSVAAYILFYVSNSIECDSPLVTNNGVR